MVATQQEVTIVSTALLFPLTSEQVANPVLQASLAAGMAASLGLEADKVDVTHVNGVALARRRRLGSDRALGGASDRALGGARKLAAAAADVTFGIESASSKGTEVALLKEHVVTAATEGSIVANVQKQAAEKGVLVSALRDMERELDAPEVGETVATVIVYTPTLTSDDEPEDDNEEVSRDGPDDGTSDSGFGMLVGVMVAALVGLCIVGRCMLQRCSRDDSCLLRAVDNCMGVDSDERMSEVMRGDGDAMQGRGARKPRDQTMRGAPSVQLSRQAAPSAPPLPQDGAATSLVPSASSVADGIPVALPIDRMMSLDGEYIPQAIALDHLEVSLAPRNQSEEV
jgi:hypothetical protein